MLFQIYQIVRNKRRNSIVIEMGFSLSLRNIFLESFFSLTFYF